ncbi:hypothetical protein XELAEV_18040372mg [Xenopus laevis]|uniref:Uncharacterized protein n=1 Tax=Xenopus laevis TaxID=8355 RepID=A0A974H8V0_XENLA|nr:hypothetical protein XELAEV_18040372mg [Xenopus laevis]
MSPPCKKHTERSKWLRSRTESTLPSGLNVTGLNVIRRAGGGAGLTHYIVFCCCFWICNLGLPWGWSGI